MPSVSLTLGLAVLDCWEGGGGHVTLGPAVLDRWQGAAATSAGRGWPFRPGEGPVMPSVPLTLGLAVLDRREGGAAATSAGRGCPRGPGERSA